MSECTCNKPQRRQNTCFRCRSEWKTELSHHEKLASCPEHRMCIAICGGSPPICEKCTNEGYYVEPSLGFGSIPEIKKR